MPLTTSTETDPEQPSAPEEGEPLLDAPNAGRSTSRKYQEHRCANEHQSATEQSRLDNSERGAEPFEAVKTKDPSKQRKQRQPTLKQIRKAERKETARQDASKSASAASRASSSLYDDSRLTRPTWQASTPPFFQRARLVSGRSTAASSRVTQGSSAAFIPFAVPDRYVPPLLQLRNFTNALM
jgi:hypothetical protein